MPNPLYQQLFGGGMPAPGMRPMMPAAPYAENGDGYAGHVQSSGFR